MDCLKEHGFEKEGFDPDEIAYGASHPDGIVNDTSHGAGRAGGLVS
jgi:hypothetical protein